MKYWSFNVTNHLVNPLISGRIYIRLNVLGLLQLKGYGWGGLEVFFLSPCLVDFNCDVPPP